ncbi:SGNH/GDSL hydrolase family protein [Pseudonocardia sp. CA-107938]|uniref:SGNH/GDSL hydrolase family protein n=1 Tax=Pseudonocardia sp. CA-107938 TaxID=3240021 RepID=UPI003D8BC4D7
MRVRVLGAVLVAAAAALIGPAAHAAEPLHYVALGDSSAAGPLIPNQIDLPCTRSDRNWPHVLAGLVGAALTDVTCSGAKTTDLGGRQFGVVPPQYDALSSDTDLVTLAIGANDIDMGTVVPSCASPLPDPGPASCAQRYTRGGEDQLAARIEATAPKIAAALDEIHRRSPDAEVLVVGYLTYWRPGGCHPVDPIPSADADYLQATFDRLMAMLAEQAAAHGARYVDIRTPSADSGLCAAPGERWVEGLVPTAPAFPYHPNARGMAGAAGIVAGEL